MRKNPRLSTFFLLCMLTLYCQSFSWAKVKNLNDSVVVAWPFEGDFNDISGMDTKENYSVKPNLAPENLDSLLPCREREMVSSLPN